MGACFPMRARDGYRPTAQGKCFVFDVLKQRLFAVALPQVDLGTAAL